MKADWTLPARATRSAPARVRRRVGSLGKGREGGELLHQRSPARDQPPAQVAVDQEARERPRLAGDTTQALLPAESEEAGRQERREQRRQGPAPAQRPRRPALRAPAQRVEDDPGHDLVGGLLLGGAAERADRARRQSVRDRVQEHPAERQGATAAVFPSPTLCLAGWVLMA